MSFKDGVAEFTLKNGETKTATGLLAGITYEDAETEAGADGYTTTSENEKGNIVKDKTQNVIFRNDKDVPENPTDPEKPTDPTKPEETTPTKPDETEPPKPEETTSSNPEESSQAPSKPVVDKETTSYESDEETTAESTTEAETESDDPTQSETGCNSKNGLGDDVPGNGTNGTNTPNTGDVMSVIPMVLFAISLFVLILYIRRWIDQLKNR